jgi:hypothetical protein
MYNVVMHECGESVHAMTTEELQKLKRDGEVKKLVSTLSHCSNILDLPPETVITLLKMNRSDMWKLASALDIVQDRRLEFSVEEMADILNDAKVARIMEEDEPRQGPVGATGPHGHIGLTGPTGPTGPSGPNKKTTLPRNVFGQIRSPMSPRRR